MFFKKLAKPVLLLSLLVSIPSNTYAYSDYLAVGGDTIGITINTEGILVVGTYMVGGNMLASDSGIKIGDVIVSSNKNQIATIEDFMNTIDSKTCKKLDVKYKRDNKTYSTTLKLAVDENTCKTGLYVKDSITGIGTLTFIDPNTKIFGALGHEILEQSTGKIVDTESGTIFDSEVINVEKSTNGTPGEKNARYYSSQIDGTIYENTTKGVFGYYSSEINSNNLYKVASVQDIKKGEAKILTVLSGTEIKEYNINITKINNNGDTKNLVFEITDTELLEKTGGIVQGMNGSPIIQGDYIIGAVTHVVVENPTKGYGIFITNMLEEAEN